MNWTSGFLRLWAALAVCWISTQTWLMWATITDPWISFKSVRTDGSVYDERIGIAVWILLPPALLLLLGFAVAWIARGFRSSAPPKG
jgi:hypothetical protein